MPSQTESGTVGVKPLKISMFFGTAAADKDYNSRELKVYITDFLPYKTGKLEATEVKSKVGTEDSRSDGGEGNATLTNTITSEYFDLFSNRYYPPDIRKGEQVILFNIGDSDTYYWYSQGRDDRLRRCEKLRFAISDDVAFDKELNNDNTWFIEMNTLPKDDGSQRKELVISTSKSDKEEFRYLFKIDAVANTLQINDDADNMILMESKEKRIFIRNTDGCSWELNKKNIAMVAVDDLTLKAGRQMVFDTPLIVDQQDKKDKAAEKISDEIHFKANKAIVLSAPMIGINGLDGKLGEVTICGMVFAKGLYSEKSGIVKVVKCDTKDTGIKGDSSATDTSTMSIESFMTRAAAMFTTSESPTARTSAESSGEPLEFSTQDHEPIEDNRPTELKSTFADGTTDETIRDDYHMHNSVTPPEASKHTGVEIDTTTATKSDTNNTPNSADDETGRHAGAWDQITSALDRTSVAIQSLRMAIDGIVGALQSGESDITSALSSASELAKYADKLGVEASVLGKNAMISTTHTG